MEFHSTPANSTGLANYNVLLFQQGILKMYWSPNPWKYRRKQNSTQEMQYRVGGQTSKLIIAILIGCDKC